MTTALTHTSSERRPRAAILVLAAVASTLDSCTPPAAGSSVGWVDAPSAPEGVGPSSSPYSCWARVVEDSPFSAWIRLDELPGALDGTCVCVLPDGSAGHGTGIYDRGQLVRPLSDDELRAVKDRIPGRPNFEVVQDGQVVYQAFYRHSMQLVRERRWSGGRLHDSVYDAAGRLRIDGWIDFDRYVGTWRFVSIDGNAWITGEVRGPVHVRGRFARPHAPPVEEGDVLTTDLIRELSREIDAERR
jgi:hypothetical protein